MTNPAAKNPRIQSVDILRGIVMIIMALDHTRDFFSDFKFNPTDLQHTSPAMFFTRWITHYCAPIFIFFTGASAFLYSRNKPRSTTSFWLLTRGLWLLVLELTVIHFGWTFDPYYDRIIFQVIWALGWCMIFLSAFIFLPWQVLLGISLLLIFGHDATDAYLPPAQGASAIFWHLLHIQGPIALDKTHSIMVIYPLVPWVGVMAAGYCFGRLFSLPAPKRDQYHYLIGLSAIGLFIALRFLNIYGDPSPWTVQQDAVATFLSFLNCSKYPPSLLYLLMTLGPAITALPLLEKMGGWGQKICAVYGRVPLFYYILHIYYIHIIAILLSYFLKDNAPVSMFTHPGYPLYQVYGIWLAIVALLYFPCWWFMNIKIKYKWWWLSYL